MLSVWCGLKFTVWERVKTIYLSGNPFPNNPLLLQVWNSSLLKTLWEKEKCCKPAFFPFQQCFLPYHRQKSSIQQELNCCMQMLSIKSSSYRKIIFLAGVVICRMLSVWCGLKFAVWERVKTIYLSGNPFPNNPLLLQVWNSSLLKTLWEKEKCCKPAFFPFQQCFLPYHRQKSSIQQELNCCMQMLSIKSSPRICCLGKG